MIWFKTCTSVPMVTWLAVLSPTWHLWDSHQMIQKNKKPCRFSTENQEISPVPTHHTQELCLAWFPDTTLVSALVSSTLVLPASPFITSCLVPKVPWRSGGGNDSKLQCQPSVWTATNETTPTEISGQTSEKWRYHTRQDVRAQLPSHWSSPPRKQKLLAAAY